MRATAFLLLSALTLLGPTVSMSQTRLSLAASYRVIMPIGDSITLGAGFNGGYRILLEQKLKARGYKFQYIGGLVTNSRGMYDPGHEGHGGWSTNDILNGRTGDTKAGKLADWLKKWKPDTAILMTGTNDDWWSGREVWVSKYEKVLSTLFTFNPKLKVVMVSIPKSYTPVTGKSQGEAMCYDIVKKEVAAWKAKGYDIAFADCYTSFNMATDLSDYYHPNQNGYQKIANAINAVLTK